MQKLIKSMTGYKGTDKDMRCQGFQFELGKWYEMPEGDLVLCSRGFHFCKYPSGPYSFYSDGRVFKVEAEDVLDLPVEPGSDYKLVCRKIRLVEEVKPDGNRNTGDSNTGYRNTGDSNTGDSNTGDRNTGYRNTGYRNTGYRNTGDNNTGDSNTGNSNTGYRNTGYSNTGYRNTGDSNTGDSNTGDSNTGNGNVGNHHAGFFSQKPERVISFDVQTKYTREQFMARYKNLVDDLSIALLSREEISYSRFKKLPGITKAKLKKLHEAHLKIRNPQGG